MGGFPDAVGSSGEATGRTIEKSFSSYKEICWAVIQERVACYIKGVEAFGSLFFLPLGSFDANEVAWMNLPWTVMVAMLFTALCVTVLAYTLWNYGVARIGVVRMTIYGYLPPIIGVLMATVLLHE